MFLKTFPSGPLQTNGYLLACEETKEAALIDAPIGCLDLVMEEVDAQGFSLKNLLLTHSHWDHFGDAHLIKLKTGAKLWVHPKDAHNLKEPGSDGLNMMVPIHAVSFDGFLEEGQVFEVGALHLKVIHTPGHSPGGVCFYLRAQGVLFSGDTLFRGSFGNLQLATAKAEEMWPSLRKLAKLPKETKVYPGHAKETTIERESWLERAEEIFSR